MAVFFSFLCVGFILLLGIFIMKYLYHFAETLFKGEIMATTVRERTNLNQQKCLYMFKNRLPFIVFDTETTGTDVDIDEIVELAAIKYGFDADGKPKQLGRMDMFIKPQFPMSKKVVDIHGITNEFLEDKPDAEFCIKEIMEFFTEEYILVGHNITTFDVPLLENFFARQGQELRYSGTLDTLEVARDVFDFPQYSLSFLAEECGLDVGLTFHRAIDDVIATDRLLSYCYDEYKEKYEYRLKFKNMPKLYVNYCSFWKGYRKEQAGVWVNTNCGKVYFSTYKKAWVSSEIKLSEYDINALEEAVLKDLEVTYKELCTMTEKRFDLYKQRKWTNHKK